MFMKEIIYQKVVQVLDLILIQMDFNMVHQMIQLDMLVIQEIYQLIQMVLLKSLLKTNQLNSVEINQLLVELALYIKKQMILDKVEMLNLSKLEMLDLEQDVESFNYLVLQQLVLLICYLSVYSSCHLYEHIIYKIKYKLYKYVYM